MLKICINKLVEVIPFLAIVLRFARNNLLTYYSTVISSFQCSYPKLITLQFSVYTYFANAFLYTQIVI